MENLETQEHQDRDLDHLNEPLFDYGFGKGHSQEEVDNSRLSQSRQILNLKQANIGGSFMQGNGSRVDTDKVSASSQYTYEGAHLQDATLMKQNQSLQRQGLPETESHSTSFISLTPESP